jgi:hypothetical protein
MADKPAPAHLTLAGGCVMLAGRAGPTAWAERSVHPSSLMWVGARWETQGCEVAKF